MPQFHYCRRLSDSAWLVEVQDRWPARFNVTKTATARAYISENHDRRGAAPPAFAHIGALGRFADRMKPMFINNRPDFGISGACR